MQEEQVKQCEGLYSALDCLCVWDFAVECILFSIAIYFLSKVIFRLCKMRKPGNYTIEQQSILKASKIVHWNLLIYLIFFELCILFACLIYGALKFKWGSENEQVNLNRPLLQILIKTFWLLLYGYITILNIIFTIIAYIFHAKSQLLRHKKEACWQFWGFITAVICQILSYASYFYLVIYFRRGTKTGYYLFILRCINLGWSLLCTGVMIYIYCVIYNKKVNSSVYISEKVKRIEKKNIFWLTTMHILRIVVEICNISLDKLICGWRSPDDNFLDKSFVYALYLLVANFFLNVAPVLFILKVFKPPKRQFLRPSLISTSSINY